MASYPVLFDIQQPEKFDRIQLLLRVAIIVVLSILGGVLGWVYGLVWLGIPVLAAVLISQKGAERYLAESPDNMTKWLGLVVGAYAWLGLLTDKLPGADDNPVRFEVQPTGTPSIGQALLRIILVIPHLIVLGILGFVAFILMVVAAIMILIQESYPEGIYSFLRGFMRWEARVLVYMGSLVDEYPPFSLDTGTETLALPAVGSAPEPPAP